MTKTGSRALRRIAVLGLMLGIAGVLGTASEATAQSPTVTVESRSASFQADTDVRVTVSLSDAALVAGLDLVLEYDAERLATQGDLSTHVDGGLFGLLEVNHEFDFDGVTQRRQIKVAAASAQALGSSGGTLLEIDFPVTCLGYAQAFPDGRDVTVNVVQINFFDEEGQPLSGSAAVGVLDLDCTTVSTAAEQSMSTIKALYRQ